MMIPFVLLQSAVLFLWWTLWFFWNRMTTVLKLLVFALFLGACIGWGIKAYRYYWPQGLIISEQAALYLGPEKNFPKRALMQHGEHLLVVEKKDGWYYVSTSHGHGWVEAADVALEEHT